VAAEEGVLEGGRYKIVDEPRFLIVFYLVDDGSDRPVGLKRADGAVEGGVEFEAVRTGEVALDES